MSLLATLLSQIGMPIVTGINGRIRLYLQCMRGLLLRYSRLVGRLEAVPILVQGNGLDTGSDYRCRYAELITTSDGPYPPNPTTVHCTSPWFYDSGGHGLQITLKVSSTRQPYPSSYTTIRVLSASHPPLDRRKAVRMSLSPDHTSPSLPHRSARLAPQPKAHQTLSATPRSLPQSVYQHTTRLCVSRRVEDAIIGALWILSDETVTYNASLLGSATVCGATTTHAGTVERMVNSPSSC